MSGPKRFFVEKIEKETLLSGEEFEHAKNVLRLSVGDEVVLLDNSGKEYSAVIAAAEKRCMKLHVIGENEGDREATADVALLFGYLKNADKNEFIVQKAVELGVKKIVAFSSEYSSAYMNENKLERLNKVSLKEADGYENKLFACEFAKDSEAELSTLKGGCALIVGSEGGFSEKEAALAKENGFSSITLGKRILRAETAAVALTAVVMFSLGELGGRRGGKE